MHGLFSDYGDRAPALTALVTAPGPHLGLKSEDSLICCLRHRTACQIGHRAMPPLALAPEEMGREQSPDVPCAHLPIVTLLPHSSHGITGTDGS